MEALALPKLRSHSTSRFTAASLLRCLGAVLIAALLICGGWLMTRRLAGSFAAPLEAVELVIVGAAAVLWAAIARLMWVQSSYLPCSRWRQRSVDWAPTVGLVLIATSAILPGSSVAAALLVWALIGAEEVGASLLARRSTEATPLLTVARPERARTIPSRATGKAPELNEPLSPYVRQQQTRERAADGRETVRGMLRAAFSTGQRVSIEHIVFCPMFDGVPRVSAAVLDELACSARATHLYRYGARLEIKLSEPCEDPLEVVVQYDAQG